MGSDRFLVDRSGFARRQLNATLLIPHPKRLPGYAKAMSLRTAMRLSPYASASIASYGRSEVVTTHAAWWDQDALHPAAG